MANLDEQTKKALLAMIQTTLSSAAKNFAESKPKFRGSFANCTARFTGQNSHEAVEEFIRFVENYKALEEISDDDALKGFPLLLGDLASTWWQGARKDAKTWEAAIELLRENFSPQKPAHQIYMEFFENKQDARTPVVRFILEKRALLAQLPDGRHDEEVELDMLYGLLHIKYRKHIARGDVSNFKELRERAHSVEQIETEAEAEATQSDGNKRTKRCTHCNFRGHTFHECRKRKQSSADEGAKNGGANGKS